MKSGKDIYGTALCAVKAYEGSFMAIILKAVFDFANFIQCGQDPWDAYSVMKPYIEYIHVKDARKADGVIVPAGKEMETSRKSLKDLFEHGYKDLFPEPHLTGI